MEKIVWKVLENLKEKFKISEATLHRFSHKKVFWKYAANLPKNAHAELQFQ